jgi:lipoate-protein ligase A
MRTLGPIRLVRDEFSSTPEIDTAVSRALLLRASAGEIDETFRLHVPGNVVAFGKRDTLEPGYPAAITAARRRGFSAIERLAGGRAAVFTHGTLAFAWTVPDPDPRPGIYPRFRELADIMVGAFARVGIPSQVGALPGEYCPGDYSVNHAGTVKVMGVGQRLARHAAHVGGVVVVKGSPLVRDVLVDVYAALDLSWDPATAGALADVRPDLDLETAAAAIIAELADRREVRVGSIDETTLSMARRLAPEHVPA